MQLKQLFALATILMLTSCGFFKSTDKNVINEPIKVACVGNSITYGYEIPNRDSLSYPARLQQMLGDGWIVGNFGISARTLMYSGDLPYANEDVFIKAKEFNPDIVIIKLGTNDTKPQNWEHKDDFTTDYKRFVSEFQNLDSSPLVVAVKVVPAFPERWGIRDSIIKNELNPMIEQVAKELGIPLIDMHTPFIDKGELFPDKIHPNIEGANLMAEKVYEFIKEKQKL